MAYNPVTGEFDYGGESYDAPTAGVGMAMAGMGAVGADVPLAFRMMENMPGITAMAGYNARRYSNTMFRGGFLDVNASGKPVSQGLLSRGLDKAAGRVGLGDVVDARRIRKAQQFGATIGGVPQKATADSFLFGNRRFAGGVPDGKTPIFKQSRVTNFTARPRIFNRMASVTQLGGVANQGFYTPFQGGSFLESMFGKRARAQAIKRGMISSGSDETMFSGGTLGRMTTMSNVYSLENQQRKLVAKSLSNTGTRTGERAARKQAKIGAKLAGLDQNILTLTKQTGGPGVASLVDDAMSAVDLSRFDQAGLRASLMDDIMIRGQADDLLRSNIQTNRLRAISDSSKGVISRSITEYMGTMLDPSKFQGTRAYKGLETNIKKALYYADDATDLAAKKVAAKSAKTRTAAYLAGGADDLGKFGVRSLAGLSKTALAGGQKMVAAKLAGAAGTRALGLALPGLNVIATASMVYDLTKLAATGIVSAGNFAKDAVKSMQGSIHKPLFGMGYQDTEVAATSRARGVMAIQNSRLNARSTLGSEASMMAAHFG